jgi:hypothetical protein
VSDRVSPFAGAGLVAFRSRQALVVVHLGTATAKDAVTKLNPRFQAIIDHGKGAAVDPEKPNSTLD